MAGVFSDNVLLISDKFVRFSDYFPAFHAVTQEYLLTRTQF